VVARLPLVRGYEGLDLAFPSVKGRAILENQDEGVESLILHFNDEDHLPACARSDTLDMSMMRLLRRSTPLLNWLLNSEVKVEASLNAGDDKNRSSDRFFSSTTQMIASSKR